MNILSWIVLAFLVVSMVIGGRKGFVKAAFSTFTFILAILLAGQIGPIVGNKLRSTPVHTVIERQIKQTVEEKFDGFGIDDETALINQLPIPSPVKRSLIKNNKSAIYDAMGVSRFETYISEYLTFIIMKVISFILAFILILIVLSLLEKSLGILTHLPVIKSMNTLGGVVFGLVNGLFTVWMFCLFVAIISHTGPGHMLYAQVTGSPFMKFLYDQNIFMMILTSIEALL